MMPVFMIGTQRSGSNLLRLMINQLKQIVSPHPPHILERIYPLLEYYGDLDTDSNFRLLIDDVCKLVELNPVAWDGATLNRNDVFSRCRERNLIAVHGAVYDIYAEFMTAETWCCKSLANIKYADDIEDYFIEPKYIYLYRDGRDVALSFQRAVVGEKHIFNIAREWAATQNLAFRLQEWIGPRRFFSISYEQLTADPEGTAKSLCAFLGMDYTGEMLDFHRTEHAKNTASASQLWSNVVRPVMKNNTKKYRSEMDISSIEIFESVAGEALDRLGYERDFIKKGEEFIYSDTDIQVFNEMNRRMKMDSLGLVDKRDLERRNRQAELLENIRRSDTASRTAA